MKNFKLFEKCNRRIARRVTLIAVLLAMCMPQAYADLYLIGSMNSWNADNWDSKWKFVTNKLEVELDANTNYYIRIKDGYTDRYFNGGVSGTILDYNMDCTGESGYIYLTTAEAGVYTFHYQWTGSQHHISIYYPRARLKPGTIIYFDATSSNTNKWRDAAFHAKYLYKNFDTGTNISSDAVQWSESPVETWVHYTTVPNNDYIGQVQICRMNPSDHSKEWNYSGNALARERSDDKQNCMIFKSAHAGYDNTQQFDWKTYCPPKATSTISDNGTVKTWGGAGTSASPYLIAAGSKIKVSASSTNYIEDANMTTKYDFQVRNTSGTQQAHSDGIATTYEYTSSSSNNTTCKVRVNSYNYYNSTSSTENWSDGTEIYYLTRTPYNIAYNKGANGTGDNVTDVKLKGYNITLRGAIFTRTGYTQTAWNTNNNGTSGTSHPLNENYTSDNALTLYPTWTAKTTTVTLNPNTENHGTGSNVNVTATYDSSLPSFVAAVPEEDYYLTGYYTDKTGGTKVINADGTFAANSGTWNREDGATLLLYAQYDEIDYCYEFAPSLTSGTIANHDIIVTSSGGIIEKDGGTMDYTSTGLYFEGSSSTIVRVALANNMTAGTIIKATFTNGNSTESNRGVKLCTTSTTTAVGDWKWSPAAKNETKTFTYVVTGSGTFDGENVFRLIRQNHVYLTSLKVGNCGSAATKYNVGHTLNNVTKSSGLVGNSVAIAGANYTAVFAADDGYELPESVSVSIGNSAKTQGTNFFWNQSTGTLVIPGAQVTGNIAISITGAAAASTYSITYDCDDATSGCPSNLTEQTALPNPLPSAPTKNGYTFGGWYTDDTFETSAVAGATLSDDVTLYAKWTCTTPTISNQPEDATVCKDESSPTLSVTASANGGSLSYQWYSNTTKAATVDNEHKIDKATSASYSAPTSAVGTKYYYCVVTNTTGSCSTTVTSDIATVTVNAATAIGTQPTSIAKANVGSAQTLSVVATGSNLTYQWQTCNSGGTEAADVTGSSYSGGKTSTLTFTPSAAGVTYYKCVVTGDCGTSISNVVSITAKNVITSPSLTYASTTIEVGQTTAEPTVTNPGEGTVTYESSATGVATVDSDGKVRGVAVGSATITANIPETSAYWGTTASATFTVNAAFVGSSSINIEKWVLDNRKNFSGLKAALTAANIVNALDGSTALDSLDDNCSKTIRNAEYLGLKIKNTNDSVKINLPAGSELNVKFGYINDSVRVLINGVRTDSIKNATTKSRKYTIASAGVNRVVKFVATTGKAAVIKQIMIDEDTVSVTLPATIACGSTTNGTISVASAKVNVGSTVTVTVTPASGYELETLSYTPVCPNDASPVNIDKSTKRFTMPNGNVTINATFVLSGHSVTAATSTGADTYGTVSAAAATVAEGGTTVITATPATGYKVTNWAVEGAGASITPSGASNSNTTTLTMGSADATVTVTFGPKTYTLTLDKNGGSADGSASITWNQRLVTFDPHATAPNASFSLDGYYTAAEGGTKIINGSGSEYIVSEYIHGWTSDADLPSWAHDADATLYAYWRRYINLNSNWDYHGKNINYGSVSVILGGAPSGYVAATGEEGYTLQGYYTEVLGGTKVFNADGTYAADDVDGFIEDGKWIYTTEGTLSLYAHWAKQYTVTYDGNEATSGSAPSATSAFFGDDVTVAGNIGTLVKTGYSFVGWNTAADGTGSFYAVGSEFTLTGNMTLYAQWESCSGTSCETWSGSPSDFTEGEMIVGTNLSLRNNGCDSRSTAIYDGSGNVTNIEINNNSDYIEGHLIDGSTITSVTVSAATNQTTSQEYAIVFSTSSSFSSTVTVYTHSAPAYNAARNDENLIHEFTAPANTKYFRLYRSFTYNETNYGDGKTIRVYGIEACKTGGGCTTHTVSFANMDDFAGSSTLPSEIEDVYTDSKIAEPVNPTADGYAFAGWYKEGACSNKWDFATDVVDDDITLYAKWVSLTEQYTFHMGDGDISNHSWNVTTFTSTGYYENQAISNFEIPNQDRYPSFFVGYEGEFVEYAPSSGYSTMREWDDYNNMGSYQSGYIKIQGNASPISDGNTKTAAGAKGTLQMSSSTHSENWGLVFIPDGFGLTISYEEDETPETLIVPLHKTDNEKVWETESFTTAKGNALTAAQIAGTFKVGLATATPDVYVDCYQTTEEAASAINARKLAAAYGGADMAAGASGRFQIIMSSNTSLPNFGLRWVPLENHTKQSGSWDGMGVSYTLSDKWSLEHAPTIEEDVYIEHYTSITNDAQANSVYINKSTAYMNLTISSIGSLLVMNDIKAKMADDDAYRATTENDINIETDYIYNGSLITAKKSTDTKASYRFCTKAYKAGGYGYINQFIGIPFTEMDAFQLYGSLLYQYDKDANKWVTCSQNMEAYHAYNILRRSTEGRAVFDLDGTLILPGIEAGNKEKVLECNSGRSAEASSWRGEHLFANSWTAPIEIGAMTEGDFHDVDPTIYIFNAGSVNTATDDQKEEYDLGDNPGQWTALPVNDVKEHPENYSYKVIPAMQAFSIRATAANGTLTLDYKKHVYDPIMANSGVVDHTALRAPKQNVEPSVRLRMVVTGENYYKDETQIHERADFSNGHDAGWDGYKIFGNAHSPQLYTVSDNKQLSVNAIPDMEGTVVGFEKGSDDNVYTFSFKYDGEDIWYLNDLKEQTSTLINNENTYIFSSESGDAAMRFIISATPIMKVTTGVENVQSDDVQSTKVHKVLINDHIYIIRGGRMYDATGKMLK